MLHLILVLVTETRMRLTDLLSLEKLSRVGLAIASKKAYRVSARSVMPDHLLLAEW